MSENSMLQQISQIGLEATPGTPATSFKRINGLSFDSQPDGNIDTFRPDGYKYSTVAVPGKEMVKGKITGTADYHGLLYLLSGLLGQVAPVTATGASTYTFAPSTTSADNPAIFTFQNGSALSSKQASYGLINEVSLEFSREAIKTDGAYVARALDTTVPLATGVNSTEILALPLLPKNTSVYLDTSGANIGTTKMLRAFEAKYKLGDRFDQVWALDAAQTSYVAHVESVPKSEVSFLLEVDSQSLPFLTNLRSGQFVFIRIENIGSQIGAGPAKQTLQLDCALLLNKVASFKTASGNVYAIEFTGEIAHEATWGKALQAKLITDLATL